LREEAVRRERRPFVERGGCLSREGEGRSSRKGGGHSSREGGWPSIEGGCHSLGGGRSSGRGRSSGGGHLAREEAVCREGEETVRRGREFVERCSCSSMWWEGRTMNFRVGKFKIQHNRMMSEFERT